MSGVRGQGIAWSLLVAPARENNGSPPCVHRPRMPGWSSPTALSHGSPASRRRRLTTYTYLRYGLLHLRQHHIGRRKLTYVTTTRYCLPVPLRLRRCPTAAAPTRDPRLPTYLPARLGLGGRTHGVAHGRLGSLLVVLGFLGGAQADSGVRASIYVLV